MKFEKKSLTELHRCYATGSTIVNGERHILLATEGEGACYSYIGDDFKQSTVWDGPGGTMSMIPIPGKNGDFLAVQNFFPTFQSEKATIVWARPTENDSWDVKKILDLPYVHRFDILSANGVNYFLGSVLCNSKQFKDDWSDPGKIYVGVLPEDLSKPIELRVIKEGLTKNHGYCRTTWDGKMAGIVTSEEGAFVVTPPQNEGEEWRVEQIMNRPISDIAVVDIDEDGEDELITIEDFHGSNFLINKKIDGEYKEIYKYPKEMDFGHVVWGGKLRGIPSIIGGYRRVEKELFVIQCEDKENLKFKTQVIEAGVGPSNVAVVHEKNRDIIISANRELGEAALYFVTE
ncbi:hypothetical protein FDC50_01350 [Clostridium botulinum]|nr:hypothetical protein KU41_09755 [Clostridium botulinum]MBY6801976.1 hypothetical protein [Clostridium botulinum]MBY6812116.1 hypothetical protein [Clostridium botulinum]MBY6819778.1 hypothetical protein [Clostridium botulinum]NFJ50958.1 hypothetical protein [Clostridium botulinum]